jgi:hypothetical protein
MSSKSGRCLCGAVSFTAAKVEPQHHACHCGMCRRWAGGPVLAAAVEGVEFSGVENLGRSSSSEWAQRGFCKTCGSSLFYYLVPANQYLISVGAFDDASQFHLALEIFSDRKPTGYAFAGDHPRWTEAETLAHHEASDNG